MSIDKILKNFYILSIFFIIFSPIWAGNKISFRYKNRDENLSKKSTIEETLGILATVNGRAITIDDVIRLSGREELKLSLIYDGDMLTKKIYKLRKHYLDVAIERELIYLDFINKDFPFPENYLVNYMDRIAKAYDVNNIDDLRQLLKSRGILYANFKKRVYKDAIIDLYTYDRCYKNVYVTPQDVFDYYIRHRNYFKTKRRLKLQVFRISKEKLKAYDISFINSLANTLKRGDEKTFRENIMLYSDAPIKEKNGNIGWIELDKLRPEFKNAIDWNSVKVGEVVGPINTEDGYFFVRVSGIKDGGIESYEDAKKKIRRLLTFKRREKNYKDFVTSLKEGAYIKYYLNNK